MLLRRSLRASTSQRAREACTSSCKLSASRSNGHDPCTNGADEDEDEAEEEDEEEEEEEGAAELERLLPTPAEDEDDGADATTVAAAEEVVMGFLYLVLLAVLDRDRRDETEPTLLAGL
jgi:hypothetical protein